jgi:hypothetical protein
MTAVAQRSLCNRFMCFLSKVSRRLASLAIGFTFSAWGTPLEGPKKHTAGGDVEPQEKDCETVDNTVDHGAPFAPEQTTLSAGANVR